METTPQSSAAAQTPQSDLLGVIGLIQKGWEIFKKRPMLAVVSVFTPMIAMYLIEGLATWTMDRLSVGVSFVGIVAAISITAASTAQTALGLKMVRGEDITLSAVLSRVHRTIHYFFAQFVFQIIVFIGLILFIIPGFIFAIRFSFAPILIIDTDLGIIDSFRASWQMSEGRFWQLLGRYLGVIILLGFFSLVTLFFGVIITMPIGLFALFYAYETLKPTNLPKNVG